MDGITPNEIYRAIEERTSKRLNNGCKVWEGQTNGSVPRMRVNGRKVDVRRVMVFAVTGKELPDGYGLRTTCTRHCVNPRHIEVIAPVGTVADMAKAS